MTKYCLPFLLFVFFASPAFAQAPRSGWFGIEKPNPGVTSADMVVSVVASPQNEAEFTDVLDELARLQKGNVPVESLYLMGFLPGSERNSKRGPDDFKNMEDYTLPKEGKLQTELQDRGFTPAGGQKLGDMLARYDAGYLPLWIIRTPQSLSIPDTATCTTFLLMMAHCLVHKLLPRPQMRTNAHLTNAQRLRSVPAERQLLLSPKNCASSTKIG